MANTAISALGEDIQCSGGAESLEPCLGDGAVKAGMLCDVLSTGKASAIDANSATLGLGFVGIMDRHYSIDIDTEITDSVANNLISPKSGRIYRCFIEDFAATGYKGRPLGFSETTAGSLVAVAPSTTGILESSKNSVAYLNKNVASGDLVAEIRWK